MLLSSRILTGYLSNWVLIGLKSKFYLSKFLSIDYEDRLVYMVNNKTSLQLQRAHNITRAYRETVTASLLHHYYNCLMLK